MSALASFSVFLFGIVFGSFLNAYIYRLEKGESVLRGRSYCPRCRHQLTWQDLIPLLSFLLLRGTCRYCHGNISWQYPAVEFATGAIFLAMFIFEFFRATNSGQIILNQFFILNFEILLHFFYLLIISSLLIIIFVYDLRHFIIPDKVLFPAIALVALWQIVSLLLFQSSLSMVLPALWSAMGASSFFLAVFLLTRGRGMGFGDVKLAFFMGLFLSWPNILVSLFVAFFLGAIIGVGLILLKKKNMRSEVPFGPFLIAGTFIALLWGKHFVYWYSGLIF